jgi:hypothetical protein
VQLSTGASTWDTPTHAAPTGPTPQVTPQSGIEHPYGTPGEQIITNPDGSQSVKYPDGRVEPLPADGDRGLGGSIGVWFLSFGLLRRLMFIELCDEPIIGRWKEDGP